jgi:hypothetical protein
MKREIEKHIKKFLMTGKPLTDSQARTIAYWELVDFQCDNSEPGTKCCDVLNKFLENLNNEMFLVV